MIINGLDLVGPQKFGGVTICMVDLDKSVKS